MIVALPAQAPLVSEYLVEVEVALTVGAELAPVGNPVTNESPGAWVFVGAFELLTPGIAAMSRRLLDVLRTLGRSVILFFSA